MVAAAGHAALLEVHSVAVAAEEAVALLVRQMQGKTRAIAHSWEAAV